MMRGRLIHDKGLVALGRCARKPLRDKRFLSTLVSACLGLSHTVSIRFVANSYTAVEQTGQQSGHRGCSRHSRCPDHQPQTELATDG